MFDHNLDGRPDVAHLSGIKVCAATTIIFLQRHILLPSALSGLNIKLMFSISLFQFSRLGPAPENYVVIMIFIISTRNLHQPDMAHDFT